MEIQEKMCTLCLEKCANFQPIEENMENVLDVLLPKIDFTVTEESVMCKCCTEMVIKCFDFKATCLDTHDYIVPFVTNKDTIKLNLEDIYLSKNLSGTGVPDNHNICGFCMSLVKNCSTVSLDVEEGDVLLQEMIERCLPELDFSIIKKPVICAPCHGSLKNCFYFLMNCLIVKEKFQKYRKALNINGKKRGSLLQTVRDEITEIDDNSHEKSNVERQSRDERKTGNGGEITIRLERYTWHDIKNAKEEVEDRNESFMEHDDRDEQFTSISILTCEDEDAFSILETNQRFCKESKTENEEENLVEMEDQKCLRNEEITIKTDDHDVDRSTSAIMAHPKVNTTLKTKWNHVMRNHEEETSKPQIKQSSEKVAKKEVYQCKGCSFQTIHKSSFNKHILSEKAHTEYTCYLCSFQTKSAFSLKKHLKVHTIPRETPSGQILHCNLCTFQSKVKSNFNRHLLVHADPTYSCDLCSYQGRQKCYLITHFQNVHPSEKQMYKKRVSLHKDPLEVKLYMCHSCSYKTKSRGCFRDHLRVHKSPSSVTVYKCDSCTFQSLWKGNFQRHLLVHVDPSKVIMYKCDSCSFETKHKYGLIKHFLVHKDLSEITMYKCDSCSYQTKQKCALTQHFLRHKNPEITRYKCSSCLYRTTSKARFEHHVLNHKDPSEVKMYKCDVCQYQTKCKPYLTSHLILHKDPSEVTIYKCTVCPYQTRIQYNFNKHLLVHKDPSEITWYKCASCPYQSNQKYNLRKHLQLHKDASKVKRKKKKI